MNDVELIALAAVANLEAVQMQGDNDAARLRGDYPQWSSGSGYMSAGTALYEELAKRGILK